MPQLQMGDGGALSEVSSGKHSKRGGGTAPFAAMTSLAGSIWWALSGAMAEGSAAASLLVLWGGPHPPPY